MLFELSQRIEDEIMTAFTLYKFVSISIFLFFIILDLRKKLTDLMFITVQLQHTVIHRILVLHLLSEVDLEKDG